MRATGYLLVGLTAIALVAPAAAQACPKAGAPPSRLTVSEARQAVECLLNQRRRKAGIRPLRDESRLQRAAQKHSQSMDSRNFFSHTSPGGASPATRIRASGYMSGASSWMVGEVIRWGSGASGSPKAAVAGWMKSPGHRASILTGRFRHLGVGIAIGSPVGDGTNAAIYTADFGSRG